MAYADGQLPAERRAHVEALLARDEDARRMLDRFEGTRAAIAPLASEWMAEPVPRSMVETILRHPSAPSRPEPREGQASVQPATAVARPAANESWFSSRIALAASIALAVGLVAGQWFGERWGGQPDPWAQLAHTLQTVPSGQPMSAASGSATVLGTFRAADGRICREFEQQRRERLVHGLACRTDGNWVVQVSWDRGPADGPNEQAQVFTPASDEPDTLQAVLDAMQLGPTLDAGEERALIEKGWATDR